jgi:hypothetical protein
MRARSFFNSRVTTAAAAVVVLFCASPETALAQVRNPVIDSTIRLRGAAWMQIGRIEHSSDKTSNQVYNNFEDNWQQAAGLSLTAAGRFSPQWDGAFGLGMGIGHNARGDVSVANNWYAVTSTFVGEARVTWTDTVKDNRFQISLGFFPYSYSSENKDLGLYLLRGTVYPGFVLSGFEARHATPGANIFGGLFRFGRGRVTNDVLLISETDMRPYFDLSVADVITWQALPSLQLGAGVNFYRALPRTPAPGKDCDNLYSNYTQVPDLTSTENCVILDTLAVDTVNNTATVDTVTGGLQGTKAMARFRYDPKTAFGLKGAGPWQFGAQDLVIYGEAALLGFKNYPKYYDNRLRRMPVMMGVNVPAFGWLDKLALEVEYYRSPHHTDYGKTETSSSWIPRPASINTARDDWKWALYASKVVAGNLRVSGQVANDHLRTFGAPDLGSTTYAEALTTPRDWYWMLKLTSFF